MHKNGEHFSDPIKEYIQLHMDSLKVWMKLKTIERQHMPGMFMIPQQEKYNQEERLIIRKHFNDLGQEKLDIHWYKEFVEIIRELNIFPGTLETFNISHTGFFQPQMRKITSGYHIYLLKGINLRCMYLSQRRFAE